MAFKDLLDQRVDIYHLNEVTGTSSYGVPGEIEYKYNALPDLASIPTYWRTIGNAVQGNIKDNEPGVKLANSLLFIFEATIDIRHNDKVSILSGKEVYRLQLPRKIKGHHWEVMGVRLDG